MEIEPLCTGTDTSHLGDLANEITKIKLIQLMSSEFFLITE